MNIAKVGRQSTGGVETSLIELLSNPELTGAMLDEYASTFAGKMNICNLNSLPNDVIRMDGVMGKIALATTFLEVMYSNVSFSRSIIDNYDGAADILLADLNSARSFAKSDTNKNLIASGSIKMVAHIKNYYTACAENLDIIDRLFSRGASIRGEIYGIGGKDAADALTRENESCRERLIAKWSTTMYGTQSWASEGGQSIAMEFWGSVNTGHPVEVTNFIGDHHTGSAMVGTFNTTKQPINERVSRAQIRHHSSSYPSSKVYLRYIDMR